MPEQLCNHKNKDHSQCQIKIYQEYNLFSHSPVKAKYDEVESDGADLMRGNGVEGEVFVVNWAPGLADNPGNGTLA